MLDATGVTALGEGGSGPGREVLLVIFLVPIWSLDVDGDLDCFWVADGALIAASSEEEEGGGMMGEEELEREEKPCSPCPIVVVVGRGWCDGGGGGRLGGAASVGDG